MPWKCCSCGAKFERPYEFTVYADENLEIVMDIVFKCPKCGSEDIQKNAVQKVFFDDIFLGEQPRRRRNP